MITDRIYRKDANGSLRFWQAEADGPRWRTISGLVSGKAVTTAWTQTVAKNVGKVNVTTAEEQAIAEANADLKKRLDREYRRTVEELDAVPVSPMLAQDFTKQKSIEYPVFSQPKLDGIRALVSRHGAFSREFRQHLNVEHILEALAPLFAKIPDLILDGELYNHNLRDDFNKITSIVRREAVTNEEQAEAKRLVQFHVYDVISLENFSNRSFFLLESLPDSSTICRVQTQAVNSLAELDTLYGEYLLDGYEGQMVRLNDSYEVDKRSKTLLKRKVFITAEYKLLRIEEGMGNWAGYAKRVVFALPDGREVGAGLRGNQEFTRNLLHEWKQWGDLRVVTVRHFTPTPDGIPRFPVAIDFHPDGRTD